MVAIAADNTLVSINILAQPNCKKTETPDGVAKAF